jgi:hypothetical protein
MESLPASTIWVLIVFLFLTLPLRLLIYYAKSYRLVILSRQIADGVLFALTCIATIGAASSVFYQPLADNEDIFAKYIAPASASFILSVPYFYILSYLVGRRPFYTKKHLANLDYFIVYLRSFNDERKGKKLKQRMTKALSDWFPVYAIGKPDEFMPPAGAKRIYVDDDWQEIVQDMIQRSQIILHRINTSDNYLWEFEQCYQQQFFNKSVFWVDNIEEYRGFQKIIKQRFGLDFPSLEDRKCHVVFYQLPDLTYRIIYLTVKDDYERFKILFRLDHQDIFAENHTYLYGRKEKRRHLIKFGVDSTIPKEAQGWSWVAFWCPEYYLIFQRIKHRLLLFFIFTSFEGALMGVNFVPENIFRMLLFRLVFGMILLGANGKKMVWLSHHWESIRYYQQEERLLSKAAVIMSIAYVLFWIVAIITLQFVR